MANTKSAAKSARQSARRRERNTGALTALKTEQKKIRRIFADGKPEEIRSALANFTSSLDKAAKRGIIHRNVADRKKSRLGKALAKPKA
jgi:small subunit ribosomal protein S20